MSPHGHIFLLGCNIGLLNMTSVLAVNSYLSVFTIAFEEPLLQPTTVEIKA
jgi:hypothetical protein